MHPIERLRYVARVDDADLALVAAEAGHALAAVAAEDPAGLVPACRRLIEHHGTSGPMWWLSARVLAAPDPAAEARRSARLLGEDRLSTTLGLALGEDLTVVVVGWPDATCDALRRRGDLEVLVVAGAGEGASLIRRLADADIAVCAVADAGAAAAVTVSNLLVIDAVAAGPSGILARIGSHGAAAVAVDAGVPVWATTGVGRVLPQPLWDSLLARFDRTTAEPWDRDVELVPARLLSAVVRGEGQTSPAGAGAGVRAGAGSRSGSGPDPAVGLAEPATALATSSAPAAPELLRLAD